MARKKTAAGVEEPEPKPEPAATPEPQEEEGKGGLGGASKKELLGALWQENPDATAKKIAEIFEARFGETVSLPTVSLAKPADLKKPRGGKQAAVSGDNGELTLTELMEVNAIVKEEGGLKDLGVMVAKVEGLASRVGGLGKLKQALAALTKLKD